MVQVTKTQSPVKGYKRPATKKQTAELQYGEPDCKHCKLREGRRGGLNDTTATLPRFRVWSYYDRAAEAHHVQISGG